MRVIISGGGTAGHIFPGVAIANKIKSMIPDAEILFVGTENGMESRIIPKEGFEIDHIRVSGFKRKIGTDFLKSFRKMFDGYSDAKAIIKRFQPDIVIGMGGYVCGPMLFCATRMKIPTLIHEQNSVPGVTNKLLSRVVNTVCISFESSRKFFTAARNIMYTGNPIRENLFSLSRIDARAELGLEVGEQFVVVMGGSLGAEKINEVLVEMIQKFYDPPTRADEFSKVYSGYRLLIATGEKHYAEVMGALGQGQGQDQSQSQSQSQSSSLPRGVEIRPFIHDVGTVLAAADLIVCRAGAITLSEVAAIGLPSILIPSPNVTANHQGQNALTFQRQGAAFVLLENNLTATTLAEAIHDLLSNPAILSRMGKQAYGLAKLDAGKRIVEEVKRLAKSRR